MATPTILIEQVGRPTGSSGTSRDDLLVGNLVTLTDPANGAGTYVWTMLTRPTLSSAVLSGANTDTATFTPDVYGTYTFSVSFDGTLSGYTDVVGQWISTQGGAGVKDPYGTRVPAAGEVVQFGPEGWHPAREGAIHATDRLRGMIGAAHGSVFYADATGNPVPLAPATSGYVLATQGGGAAPSWVLADSVGGNTLNAAYNEGGAGAGRAIAAGSGAVQVTNPNPDAANVLELTTTALGTGVALSITNAGDGPAMQWDNGQTLAPLGSLNFPSYSFIGEDGTGMYATASQLGFSTNAARRLVLNDSGQVVFIYAGAEATPVITDTAGTEGVWFPGSNSLALSTFATEAVRWDASQNQINAGDISIPVSNSLNFDGVTGSYRIENNATNLYFYTAGGQRMRLSAASALFSQPILINDTSVGVTSLVALDVVNTSAATVSVEQWSPAQRFKGESWNTTTTATQDHEFIIQGRSTQGDPVTSNLTFVSKINGGGENVVLEITDTGRVLLTDDGATSTESSLGFASDASGVAGLSRNFANGDVRLTSAAGGDSLLLAEANVTVAEVRGLVFGSPRAGTEALPFYYLNSDVSTGIWRPGANIYAISTGATEAVRWDASQNQTNAGRTFVPDGATTAPTIALSSNNGSGVYGSSGEIGMIYNGVGNGHFSMTNLRIMHYQNVVPNGASLYELGTTTNYWEHVAASTIILAEQEAAPTDTAGFGQVWVDNNVAQTLYFTDDAGVDFPLGGALAAGGGLTALSVTNIDDPSTELNAISGSAKGDTRLVYQTVAGTDEWTIYAWDDADSGAESVPHLVDGLTGTWSAVGGKYNSGTLNVTGQILGNGSGLSAATPDYGFAAEAGLGMYRAGTGTLRFAVGSAYRLSLTASQELLNFTFSNTVPMLGLAGDPDTGFGGFAADEAGVITGATEAVRWDASQDQYNAGDIHIGNLKNYYFDDDNDTRLYTAADDDVRLYVGSVQTQRWQASQNTSFVRIRVDETNWGTSELTGLEVNNTTAAAAGAQQWSPVLALRGQGWKTDATAGSQVVQMGMQVETIQGAAAPTGELVFKSNINSAGYSDVGKLTSGGQWLMPDGTSSLVSYGFASNDSGMYLSAADTIAWATNTLVRMRLSNSQLRLEFNGSEATPCMVVGRNDVNSGFWSPAVDTIALSTNALEAIRWNTSQQTLLPNGLQGTPSLSFADDVDSGFYANGTDTVSITVAAHQIASFTDTGATHGATFKGTTTFNKGFYGESTVIDCDVAGIGNAGTSEIHNADFDFGSAGYNFVANGPAIAAGMNLTAASYNSDTAASTMGGTRLATLYIDGAPTADTNMAFNTTPYALFVDSGVVRIDGNIEAGGQLQLDADLDSYIHSTADDVIALVTNSVASAYVSVLGFGIGLDGSAAAPSLYRSDDTDTGLWWGAAGIIGIATDGTNHLVMQELTATTKHATFTGQVGSAEASLTSAATVSTDCNRANGFELKLEHAGVTMENPTNPIKGFTYTWRIIQTTSASRTITTWGTKFLFPGGTAPTLSTAIGDIDLLCGYYDGTDFLCTFRADFLTT